MNQGVNFNVDLLRRYDPGWHRYKSYPAVNCFKNDVTQHDYRKWARRSNEDPIPRPLALYIHIPFCETLCFFCSCDKVITRDHSRAATYLEHLGREIAMQGRLFDRDRIVEQLHCGGGTPTFLAADQIRKLMTIVRRHFSLHADGNGDYTIAVDPRTVDPGKLQVLRETGFNRVSLGVQDINPRVQEAVNRIHDLERTRAVTTWARQAGFRSVSIDLMYGLPFQTVDSFGGTLEAVIEMQPDRLAIYNFRHLPGRFKSHCRISGEDLPAAGEKLHILERSIDYLAGSGYVYIGAGQYARPDDSLARALRNGTLQRDFQGYSVHPDHELVGLGVCAVSKVCDNYSQNVCDLDVYYERIDAGKYPLERGIELEPDDLLRAEIINRLMCDYVLDIGTLEQKWKFSFARYFSLEMQALSAMEKDGLLTMSGKSLAVLPEGRLLVGNICEVFDRYRHEDLAGLSKVL